MKEIILVKENNDYFKEWIKKEWISHNEMNEFYQLDLTKEIIFEEQEYYYKLMKQDKMVGFVGIILKDDELFHSHTLFIHRLYVEKNYRNLGIGTEVLKKLIAMAKKMNRDIEFECFDKHPAIPLYEKLGFKVSERKMIMKIN